MNLDTGNVGESLLFNWASRVGITISRPHDDRYGWDYFLEFKKEPTTDKPLDLQKLYYQCFVQVKTTQTLNEYVDIKLSNWDYMVKSVNPYFILFIQIDSNGDPLNVYFSHVWKSRISSVLKRLREPNVKPPHERTLRYKPNISELLSLPYEKSIVEMIISTIGSPDSYSKRKRKILSKVGYNDHRSEINIKFTDTVDGLIDLAIGKKKKIAVTYAEIREDIRFNIPAKITKLESGDFTISTTGKRIKILIKNSIGQTASFIGELFTPERFIAGKIPIERLKYRIVYPLGEIILSQDGDSIMHFTYSGYDEMVSILDVIDIAKASLILSDKSHIVSFVFQIDKKEPVTFTLPELSDLNTGYNEDHLNLSKMIVALHYIHRMLDLDLNEIIPLHKLYSDFDRIMHIKTIIDPTSNSKIPMSITFNPMAVKEDSREIENLIIPQGLGYKFNDKIVACIFHLNCSLRKKDSSDIFTGFSFAHLKKITICSENDLPLINKELQAYAALLKEQYKDVLSFEEN